MKRPSKRLQILLAVALLLYACGYVTQFIGNYYQHPCVVSNEIPLC